MLGPGIEVAGRDWRDFKVELIGDFPNRLNGRILVEFIDDKNPRDRDGRRTTHT
jgi:hypothetical protein